MSKLVTIYSISFILLFLSSVVSAQYRFSTGTYPYPSELYQELDTQIDVFLQNKLINKISKNRNYRRLLKQKRMAVGLVDLRDPENIKYATVNGNHMMYSASLPKIAVLLSALECVKSNILEYDEALKKDMRLMIAKSNNAATTRVIERMGLDKIAQVLQSDDYNFYDINYGGGLWVGKKYAKADVRKPDPLFGISHGATVHQVCRFYTMLAYGKLVSSVYNEEMQKYLVRPEINHKFVKTLKRLDSNLLLYRKSGSWRNFHSDSVLIDGKNGRRYILVALIEDPGGSKICRDLIKVAESVLGIGKKPAPLIIDKEKPIMREAKP